MRMLLLPALVAAALLSARAQPASPGRIRVLVPWDTSASFDHALSEVVRRFNAAHAEYQVELTHKGGFFETLRAIISANYANDLPDVALVADADMPTLAEMGILLPLPEAWLASKKLAPALVSATHCKGRPCSLPFQRKVAVWYFNRELLFRLNQATERIPTAWPQLAALSLNLQKNPGELHALALPASGESALPRWTALGMLPLSSPAENASEWAERMWAARGSWVPGSPNAEEATRRFMEQKAVVYLGAIDQWNYVRDNASFKWGSALPEGALSWFGTDFVIFARTAYPRRAQEFLDFLYRPETSLALFRAASTLPVTHDQLANAGWKKEIEGWPLLKSALARKLRSSNLERVPPQIREDWANAVWQAVERGAEPGDRHAKAAELRAALQKLLSTNTR
jgi:ABC-type Fe3+ transport system substrate-binding protein